VISAFDYRAEKSKLISKQLVLPQINSSIINNENQQHEKQKEIAELENQVQQQKNIFIQSLNTLKSQVEDWKKKFLLIAPIDGKVSFTSFLQENQELKAGQLICYINPENTSYYAEALIPQYNFGKVKTGQEVLLKFPAYPWQEFGSVKGTIEFISTVPSDSGYIAKLSFTNGLTTNYKKSIQYKTGLTAEAEIITADLRLTERFINSLRKNTSR
jgi:HlyD family secretion protein